LLTACPKADDFISSSGVATNGHLSGATVSCEGDKTTVTTNANGTYTFPKGCSGAITVSGGINTDTGEAFLGELKAPKGATAVNSLTTMMVVGGLTEAEVKTSLGLPSTVNLLTTDPAAENGAAYSDKDLFAKAKAVQQLLQTTMDTVATTSSVTNTEAKKAIYATAASALASQIKGTTLINGALEVSQDVVKGMVNTAVTSLKASTNATLADVKTGLNTVQPAAIAAMAAPSMAAQSQQFAANPPASVSKGKETAALIQTDKTLANQINTNKSFLNTTNATQLTALDTFGSSLKELVKVANDPTKSSDERLAGQDLKLAEVKTAQNTAATANGITSLPNHYLAINNDAVKLKTGGTITGSKTNPDITLADFGGTGAKLKWPLVDGTELGIGLLGVGTPVVSDIEVAVDISQPSKSGAFKAYISGLVASMSTAGLRIQSTATTKMIAWARNDAGSQEIYSDLSAEVSNIDTTLTSSSSMITWIPLNSALERAIVVTGDTSGVIKKLSGTFNVTLVVKGLPLYRWTDQTVFAQQTISVPKSLTSSTNAQVLTAPGLVGKFILAP
jgi:hypothetical protein